MHLITYDGCEIYLKGIYSVVYFKQLGLSLVQ